MSILKKIMIGASVLLFCVVSFGVYVFYEYKNIAVYDDNLKKHKLNAYKGDLAVFVWSPYCSSCIYSLSDIEYLQQYIEHKGGKLIVVLANDDVRMRNASKAVFIRNKFKAFNAFFDKDSKLCSFYNIQALPTLLLFKNGKLVKTIQGAHSWKNGADIATIDEFLKK